MADQDLGAAQPIADAIRGGYKKANDLMQMIPGMGTKPVPAPPPEKPNQVDPEDVRKATATFATKPDEGQKIPTQTKAQSRPSIAPKVQVKSSVKVTPRKR